MHCLEIDMNKRISLSSLIAVKLNFQKLLLKKKIHLNNVTVVANEQNNYNIQAFRYLTWFKSRCGFWYNINYN